MMKIACVLALVVAVAFAANNYVYVEGGDIAGPSDWKSLDAVCGAGRFQSPINIISSFSYYYANFGGLKIEYSRLDTGVTATETSQGVTLTSPTFNDNFLTVANVLNGTYVLDRVNLHWGQSNGKGSEHTIDFLGAAAEIQYVHYNTKFPSYTTAVSSGEYDAVSVVSVFLNAGGTSDSNLTSIINALNTTSGPMNSVINGNLNFTNLFPKNREYFTYTGSLTEPGCNEVVTWFVVNRAIPVSNKDIAHLRQVPLLTSSSTYTNAGSNLRPTQDMNGRRLKSNFIPNNAPTHSSQTASSASTVALSMVVAVVVAVLAL